MSSDDFVFQRRRSAHWNFRDHEQGSNSFSVGACNCLAARASLRIVRQGLITVVDQSFSFQSALPIAVTAYLQRESASHLVGGTEKSFAWSMAAISSRRLLYDMKNVPLKQRAINFTIVALFGLFSAGAAAATPSAENLLLSAGFKAKLATTAKQRQELKTLPEGTVSPVMKRGTTFYIYPDPPRN